jgi:cytochrome c peroxidase
MTAAQRREAHWRDSKGVALSSVLAAVLILTSLASHAEVEEKPQVLAPGYGSLQYDPPMAGSYYLPSLGAAGDGKILTASGQPLRLHSLLGDKLVLMGFIYTHCPDVNGCPLASFVMGKVQSRLAADEQLGPQVRLISLSFDPILDTPQVMRDYARHFRRKDFDWRFITTDSEAELAPILDAYGQYRQQAYDADGKYTGSMSHILRVYLVDRERRIRNIYSTSFLHADTVIADLRTLALEQP